MINGAVINGAAINAGAAAAVPVQAGDVRAWGQALGPLGLATGAASVGQVAARARCAGPLGVASGVGEAHGQGGVCLAVVATELVRRAVVSGGYPVLGVLLQPMAVRVHRARGSARYAVRVRVSGAPEPWDGGVWLVDKRGYFVEWTYQDVGRWLIKSLSGDRITVSLTVKNAGQLPAPWTADRLQKLADKVAAVDHAAMVAAADKKAATVADWGPGLRRVTVTGAADRMRQAARVAQVVQGMQAGGAWVPAGV